MTWDAETHAKITQARLLLSPPEIVYQELKLYGQHISLTPHTFSEDKELETALMGRDDALINLGLAKFGGSSEVVQALYEKGQIETDDTKQLEYNHAIRLACLSNSNTDNLFGGFLTKISPRTLIQAERYDELVVFLLNKNVPESQLVNLFKRKDDFDSLTDDVWFAFISRVTMNPRLNIDDSNEHGPDMGHYSIHKAIYEMLETAPVTSKAIWPLYGLLRSLDPAILHSPDKLIDPVLKRWEGLEFKDHKGETIHGHYTRLDLVQEFRCYIAAVYGRRKIVIKNNEPVSVPEAEDIAIRCAHYASANLKPEQMEKAYQRDQEVFIFAVLNNTHVLTKPKCREFLEENLLDDMMRLYRQRCDQLHKRWPFFNPVPLTEHIRNEETSQKPDKTDNTDAINKLISKIDVLLSENKRLKGYMFWGATIIIGLLLHYSH